MSTPACTHQSESLALYDMVAAFNDSFGDKDDETAMDPATRERLKGAIQLQVDIVHTLTKEHHIAVCLGHISS